MITGFDEVVEEGGHRIRTIALVLRRLFSFSGDVHVGHVGGSAVRHWTTGTQPEVPVPRKMSSIASACGD